MEEPVFEHYHEKDQILTVQFIQLCLQFATTKKKEDYVENCSSLAPQQCSSPCQGRKSKPTRNLKFQVLWHPPHSTDLTPCDFNALGPLKGALCGCWFCSDAWWDSETT
jgi:hypothetical protein